MVDEGRLLPARKSVQVSSPKAQVIVEGFAYARPQLMPAILEEMNNIISNELDLTILGKRSVADSLRKAELRINEVLAKQKK